MKLASLTGWHGGDSRRRTNSANLVVGGEMLASVSVLSDQKVRLE